VREVCSDNLDDFRGDVGIFDFELQLLGQGLVLPDNIEVIHEHLTPGLLLRPPTAIMIQMGLPFRHFMT
jgi:hypothetical protein